MTAFAPSVIEGCTIVDNTANTGGGLIISSNPELVVSSTIQWGNTSTNLQGPHQVSVAGSFPTGPVPSFRYCTVEGGLGGFMQIFGSVPPMFEAISALDPLLVDLEAGDYHLTAPSPCIDAGDPDIAPASMSADLDHEPRLNGPHDVGVDEFYAGLALSLPRPARAGETNAVSARGARGGERVYFFFAPSTGSTPFGFGACPSLSLGLVAPSLLGWSPSDGEGQADYSQYVPPGLSGIGLSLQAVGFDPRNAGAGCTLSNVVSFVYP